MKADLEYKRRFAHGENTVYWGVRIIGTDGEDFGGFGPVTTVSPKWWKKVLPTPIERLRTSAVAFCAARDIKIVSERIADGYSSFYWGDW